MRSKSVLRKICLRQRQQLGPLVRTRLSKAIVERLLNSPEYQAAQTIMAYVDFRGEVGTLPLLEHTLSAGKRLVLPRSEMKQRQLLCLQVTDLARDLEVGSYGIPEPISERCPFVPAAELDLIVVPGVAFSRDGYRLGYGGGYYDRFLPEEAPQTTAAGLAFEVQVVNQLPLEPHDRRLYMVVTERCTYR